MKKVFISYRRDDTNVFARLLRHELEVRIGGERIFLDRDGIEAGADFVKRIEQVIGESGLVLALIGSRWLPTLQDRAGRETPDYVVEELTRALQHSILVVPVLVDGTAMPKAGDLPSALMPLSQRNAVELDTRFLDAHIDTIVQIARRQLGLPERVARSPRDQLLLVAATNGNTKEVNSLLNEGVPVDARNDDDATPLVLAAAGGHTSVLRALIDRGADLEATNNLGQTALMAAVGAKSNPLAVKTLLDRSAQVNVRANDGTTALLIAVNCGDPNIVDQLLERGADPRITNEKGEATLIRALFIADKKIRQQVAAMLSNAMNRLK
jgi:hypothetical protein